MFKGSPELIEQLPVTFNIGDGGGTAGQVIILPGTTARAAWARKPKTLLVKYHKFSEHSIAASCE
eukprot:11377537-Heterocapsa_arctica.AAC.1